MMVTMCGSTRFVHLYHKWGKALAMSGHTPVGLSYYGTDEPNELEKAVLDAAHIRRIANTSAILVLNEGGYVGTSTVQEIVFAHDLQKRIFLLEPTLVHKRAVVHLKVGPMVSIMNNPSWPEPLSLLVGDIDDPIAELARGGSTTPAGTLN